MKALLLVLITFLAFGSQYSSEEQIVYIPSGQMSTLWEAAPSQKSQFERFRCIEEIVIRKQSGDRIKFRNVECLQEQAGQDRGGDDD